jgi:hypothetical protein
VFVSLVSKTERNIFEAAKWFLRVGTLTRKRSIISRDEFVEIDSVIGRLAFTICGKHENGELISGEGIEVVKVEFLEVCNHGVETIARMTLFGKTGRIILY